MWSYRQPQVLQTIANALGCPPKLGGKTLLLKTPPAWVTGLGEIKLVPTLKLHSYWVAFMVLEGSIHWDLCTPKALRGAHQIKGAGKRSSGSLPTCVSTLWDMGKLNGHWWGTNYSLVSSGERERARRRQSMASSHRALEQPEWRWNGSQVANCVFFISLKSCTILRCIR